MLLGGDEIGRTQQGNNNAYCQDNEISWFDWDDADEGCSRSPAGSSPSVANILSFAAAGGSRAGPSSVDDDAAGDVPAAAPAGVRLRRGRRRRPTT